MARARLELGLVGECGGWVPLIVGRGQAFGQRAVCWMGLQPLVDSTARSLTLPSCQ